MKTQLNLISSLLVLSALSLTGCNDPLVTAAKVDTTALQTTGFWKSDCYRDSEFSDYQDVYAVYEDETSGFIVHSFYDKSSSNCADADRTIRTVYKFAADDVTYGELENSQKLQLVDETSNPLQLSPTITYSHMTIPDYLYGQSIVLKKTQSTTNYLFGAYLAETSIYHNWKTQDCFSSTSTSGNSYTLDFDIINSGLRSQLTTSSSSLKITQSIYNSFACNKTQAPTPALKNGIGHSSWLVQEGPIDIDISIETFKVRYKFEKVTDSEVVLKINSISSNGNTVYNEGHDYWIFEAAPYYWEAKILTNPGASIDMFRLNSAIHSP